MKVNHIQDCDTKNVLKTGRCSFSLFRFSKNHNKGIADLLFCWKAGFSYSIVISFLMVFSAVYSGAVIRARVK